MKIWWLSVHETVQTLLLVVLPIRSLVGMARNKRGRHPLLQERQVKWGGEGSLNTPPSSWDSHVILQRKPYYQAFTSDRGISSFLCLLPTNPRRSTNCVIVIPFSRKITWKHQLNLNGVPSFLRTTSLKWYILTSFVTHHLRDKKVQHGTCRSGIPGQKDINQTPD